MKTSAYKLLIIGWAFCLFTACKQAQQSIDETLHPRPQKQKTAPTSSATGTSTSVSVSSIISDAMAGEEQYKSIFESASTLDSIQQALQNLPKLKGKRLFFLKGFYFYDYHGGMISIELQDPDRPENVDTYTYSNGEWLMQGPVKISGHFPLKLLLAPLDEVKFSTAKKVYDIGVEKAKDVEGAQPITHVYFNQIKEVHVKEWYLMIKGDRRDYQLTFDATGTLVKTR